MFNPVINRHEQSSCHIKPVWFGLYIYARLNLNQYIGPGKDKWLPADFLLTCHCLFVDENSSIFNSSAAI